MEFNRLKSQVRREPEGTQANGLTVNGQNLQGPGSPGILSASVSTVNLPTAVAAAAVLPIGASHAAHTDSAGHTPARTPGVPFVPTTSPFSAVEYGIVGSSAAAAAGSTGSLPQSAVQQAAAALNGKNFASAAGKLLGSVQSVVNTQLQHSAAAQSSTAFGSIMQGAFSLFAKKN